MTAPAQPLLVGVLVNGQDTGADINLLPLGNATYEADIDQFAAAIQSHVRETGTSLLIATPLGDADFPRASIIRHGKARYVAVNQLAGALAAEIRFDSGEFALAVKLPWTPGIASTGEGIRSTAAETPDIRAPNASLSSIHSEAYFTRQAGSNSLATLTDLQGALGPGSWRARILTNAPGDRQIMQNYGWTLDRGNNRFYLGHSQLALDPLLPYANLTGAQYAWSNRPDISIRR